MARRDPPEPPSLFDLPLEPEPRAPELGERPPAPAEPEAPESGAPAPAAPAEPRVSHLAPEPAPVEPEPPAPEAGDSAPSLFEAAGPASAPGSTPAPAVEPEFGFSQAPAAQAAAQPPTGMAAEPGALPLFDEERDLLGDEPLLDPESGEAARGEPDSSQAAAAIEPSPAGFLDRWLAGLADTALHGAVLLILLAGSALMGVAPSRAALAPLGLFLLAFSFLYCSIPLAFWGCTPGMAWRRLGARGNREPTLTFGQAGLRWLGGLLSLLLLGLPVLPATWGQAGLADRLSGTHTLRLG